MKLNDDSLDCPQSPVSCDTFVVMGDVSDTGEVVFGKNSDRPDGEVQEVVFCQAKKYGEGEKLQCTYIEVDQALETYATVLSKPAWMWGAEMGSNQAGVVIGNEAVWNRLSDKEYDLQPRLLGMDLLRLGLERSSSAKNALDVITDLLETYGQGGQCSNIIEDFSYHNSFLIADGEEAWVLETADRLWAAERITSGHRNISNCLSITTKVDACSSQLMTRAKEEGWWDGSTAFNWRDVMGQTTGNLENPKIRFKCGGELLAEKSADGRFTVKDMMAVLRDEASGINRPAGPFPTAGSQVSLLNKNCSLNCHWFTGTASPSRSVFKPFLITSNSCTSKFTESPPEQPGMTHEERQHLLWKAQKDHNNGEDERKNLEDKSGGAERKGLEELEDKYVAVALEERKKEMKDCLFGAAVEEEINIYAKSH